MVSTISEPLAPAGTFCREPACYRIDTRSSIEVEECGCAVVAPPWKHDDRVLGCHVLLFGLKGEVGLVEDGEPVHLRPGRAVLLRAGIAHGGLSRLTEPARYFWVHFRATLNTPESATQDSAIVPRSADFAHDTAIEPRFRDLLTAAEDNTPSGWKTRVRFLELLIALTEAQESPSDHRTPSQLIYRVRSRIVETLSDPTLSVKGLAYDVGVSPDYLSRQFKTAEGVPVSEYVSRLRIERSTKLLEETRLAVAKVATFCGFGSDRQFARVFRKHLGIAPGEFRQLRSMMHVNDH
jgi:AraC-like DNA-binding protein